MSQARPLTLASVKSITSKFAMVRSTQKRIKVLVASDGNDVEVTTKDGNPYVDADGIILMKRIFNLRACSDLAVNNPRNKQYLVNGMKAEKAGGTIKGELKGKTGDYNADQWFTAYVNAIQMSVGIILPNRKADLLASGVEIAASCAVVTTDNGSVLTIDPSTISVAAPEETGAFALDIEAFEKEMAAEEAKTTVKKAIGKAATK